MSRTRYKIRDLEYPYFITSSVVEGYPLFSNPSAAETVLEALNFLQNRRDTTLYAYVIMENHIHLIARSNELSKNLRAFKSWTARRIINFLIQGKHSVHLGRFKRAKKQNHIDSDYQVWQEGLYSKQIVGDKMMIQKIEYIHNNPVKRGFVDRPEYWRYSSVKNYLGMEGLIPVTLFER